MLDALARPEIGHDMTNSDIDAIALFKESQKMDLFVRASATDQTQPDLSDGTHVNARGDSYTVSGGNITEFDYLAGERFTDIQYGTDGKVVAFTADLKNWRREPQDPNGFFPGVREGTAWNFVAANDTSLNSPVDFGNLSFNAEGLDSNKMRNLRRYFEIPKK